MTVDFFNSKGDQISLRGNENSGYEIELYPYEPIGMLLTKNELKEFAKQIINELSKEN